jgi:hypothetical protein
MNTDKFNTYNAVVGIPDIRHLVSIMFGTTDLLQIKAILNKAGYPIGSPQAFALQLRTVHEDWIKNGKDIDKVKGFSGLTDPFDKVEESLQFETNSEIGSHHWFQTLMGQVVRCGEFIEAHPEHEKVKMYGKKIKDISVFIGKNFKQINKS